MMLSLLHLLFKLLNTVFMFEKENILIILGDYIQLPPSSITTILFIEWN